jgi:WhiB family redox-sensing transcriptional regulator
MIKRTNRSTTTKTKQGAADTNEFGRPIELCVVEADPDSPTAWMSEGNCRLYPPAAFFPSDGVGVDRARKICKDCPVLARCLDYALEERIEHGVWGGCSERERRRILKRRRDDALRAGTDTGQLVAIV